MDTRSRPRSRPDYGYRLQDRIDAATRRAGRSTIGALLLGSGLALAVIVVGSATFLLVWAVLVGVIYPLM